MIRVARVVRGGERRTLPVGQVVGNASAIEEGEGGSGCRGGRGRIGQEHEQEDAGRGGEGPGTGKA